MRITSRLAAFLLFLTVFGSTASAVKVEFYMMTKARPPACQPANPPQPVTSFLTTDKEAYLFFYVTDAKTGDRFASQYYTPGGQLYSPTSGEWRPLTSDGDRCFLDDPLQIAGAAPATLPGTWTVRVTYNGAPLFTLSFTISTPGQPACNFSINPTSQAAAASGGSYAVAVSADTGCAWTATSNAPWITITAGSAGTGNGTVQYTVGANAAATARTGTLTIAGQTLSVTQAAATSAAPRPAISAGGVLNGADYTPDISPGMMVSIFGQNLAPRTTAAQTVPLPYELEGVSVDVIEGGKAPVRAPLYFVSANQINIQMPFGISAASVQLRVRNAQGLSDPVSVPIVPRAPRLFTRTMDGKGEPILLHATDYSWVSAEAPAAPGEYLVLLLTGLGEVAPAIEAGRPGGDDRSLGPINRVTVPVRVSFGEKQATVLFAGLMPGFPGIYQVNLQVPSDLSGGYQPLLVSAGGVSSQDGVVAAVRWNLPIVASATVGSGGGVVRGGGVSLSIPSGAFPESRPITVYEVDKSADPGGVRVSPVVKITGLPSSLTTPITVSLDLSSTLPPGEGVEAVVQIAGAIRGIGLHSFDAVVEGNRVTFQIPATEEGSGASSSVRQAGMDPPGQIPIFGVAGAEIERLYIKLITRRFKSPSGKFLIKYRRTQVSEATIQQVGQVLDEAYKKLEDLKLEWSGRAIWPVEVLVEEFTGKHADKWGMQQTSFWGVNRSNILLNATRLAKEGVTREMRGTIGHELFHLMQELYDPRTRSEKMKAGSWFWFLEGLSTWFESVIVGDDSFIPENVRNDNWAFLIRRGLEYPPGDPSDVQEHGYGASMFLRFLAKQKGGDDKLAGVLKRMSARTTGENPQPQLSPVAALRLEYPDLSETWAEFVRAYMACSGIYKVSFPDLRQLAATATGDRFYGFKTGSDTGTTFEWSSQDLSARPHQIDFRTQWPAGTAITLTLTDPEGQSEAILYKQPGWRQVATFRDTYTIKDADQLAINKESLFVMVTNYRARAPHTGTRTLKLTVARNLPALSSYQRAGVASEDRGAYGTYQANVTVRVSGPANGLILESERLGGTGIGWLDVRFRTPAPVAGGPSEDRYTVTVTVAEPKCLRNCLDPKEWELVARGYFDAEDPKTGTSFSKTIAVPRRGGNYVSTTFRIVFSYRHIPGTKTEAQGGTMIVANVVFGTWLDFR